jgi:hypothetical protein
MEDQDHWLTHAKGGRRWLLKLGAVGSVIVGMAGNAGWDALKWGWQAYTAPRGIVMKAERGKFLVITGNVTATLRPMTLSATGTVSDPPEMA